MRVTLSALLFALAMPVVPAIAQDETTGNSEATEMMPGGGTVALSTSISVNLPLMAADRDTKTSEEDSYRRDLYARSVKECTVLLESIAQSCVITSVNVSTQLNSSPGQPDYLYASSTITMDIILK
jgi:hypothetical protein